MSSTPRSATFEIAAPRAPRDYEAVGALFIEYAESLGFSLAYQDFDGELAALARIYTKPAGALLLARVEGVAAGTVGLRKLTPETGEMKRLYVQPAHRGLRTVEGLSMGRALALGILAEACALNLRRLRLDTVVGKMDAAIRLYRSIGFLEIPPYYPSPVPGTVYMELVL